MTTAGLILAAGGSQRLGRPKQLITYRDRPLVCHAARRARDAGCERIVVVTGAADAEVRTALEQQALSDICTVHNAEWAGGQSLSLRCGAAYLLADPSVAQVLVTLCDQPLVSAEDLTRLIDAVREEDVEIAAAQYGCGGGVPACFRRPAMQALLKASGDHGAKSIIRSGRFVTRVFKIAGAEFDVDTQADVERLKPS